MTVRELIKKLEQENQDAVVYLDDFGLDKKIEQKNQGGLVYLDDWGLFVEVTSVGTHSVNDEEMVVIE